MHIEETALVFSGHVKPRYVVSKNNAFGTWTKIGMELWGCTDMEKYVIVEGGKETIFGKSRADLRTAVEPDVWNELVCRFCAQMTILLDNRRLLLALIQEGI